MDCDAAQEQLLERLDRRVDGAEAVDSADLVALHLRECDGCREFYRTQLEMDSSLEAAFPRPELSPDFHANLRRAMGRNSMPASFPASMPAWKEFLPEVVQGIGYASLSVVLTVAWSEVRGYFPGIAITSLQVFEASILLSTITVGFSSWLRLSMDDLGE